MFWMRKVNLLVANFLLKMKRLKRIYKAILIKLYTRQFPMKSRQETIEIAINRLIDEIDNSDMTYQSNIRQAKKDYFKQILINLRKELL